MAGADHRKQKRDGGIRPDLIVHLPANRDLVVDSKVSLDDYLRAFQAETEEERTLNLKRHASMIREHLKRLSGKAYWSQFERSPEFVVMFIPGESFFSAALEHDRALLEDGMEKRVILASPATLVALLRAVAYGWRQEEMTQNAVLVSRLGRELFERINKWSEHLSGVGNGLDKAVTAYNQAIASLESRVLVTARKFGELSVGGDVPLNAPSPVERTARDLNFTVVEGE